MREPVRPACDRYSFNRVNGMNIPREASQALSVVRERLRKSLLAVYLHGSAVSGGLRSHSDVDVLAVTGSPMEPESRMRLAADLMEISGRHPFAPGGQRPIELIIFMRANLATPTYPARCDFIYGEWLRNAYEAGEIPGPVCDPELTLVLAQARREAKALSGPEPDELLPMIPQADIRRAIGDCLPALAESFAGDERNVLLTLARMWRTLVDSEFVPKDVAAEWAESRLPEEHAVVLADARRAYLGLCEDAWSQRQEARRTMHALYERVMENM